MKAALAVALLLVLLMAYLVAVLTLPGQVKDVVAGPFLGLVAVLALVLGVGLYEAIAGKGPYDDGRN